MILYRNTYTIPPTSTSCFFLVDLHRITSCSTLPLFHHHPFYLFLPCASNNHLPPPLTYPASPATDLLLIITSRWTIKARVTSKSDIRKWSNAKGEGHLFSMDLMDSAGKKRTIIPYCTVNCTMNCNIIKLNRCNSLP